MSNEKREPEILREQLARKNELLKEFKKQLEERDREIDGLRVKLAA